MDYSKKSSPKEIKERFDQDVERFSNLETGQQATIDAPLAMELITDAAVASTPNLRRVLDVGCGAGNNTLVLLQLVSPLDCDLLDLSLPMLNRAKERVATVNSGNVRTFQGDIRTVELDENYYDVIIAAAVLHHLRDKADWEYVFQKLYSILSSGGSLWITDLVYHENRAVQDMMDQRYATYLQKVGGEEYQQKVFGYIAKEDSPRPVTFQLDLLRKVGFSQVDLLHKNACFAAFGAVK
jgi:tRNA (cmo5U34)-methyltransferase